MAYLRRTAGDTLVLAASPIGEMDELGLYDDLPPPIAFGWNRIVARDTLEALLTVNSTGFFIHQGEPKGFEYELLQALAQAHDLILRTIVVTERVALFTALNIGEGDVIAARLIAHPEYRDPVGLTNPLYSTTTVVVQRAPVDIAAAADNPEAANDSTLATDVPIPDSIALRARLVNRPSELAGKEVHVPAGSDYYDRITELSDSLGANIEIIEVENADQIEPLIEAAAEGKIRLTISQENLAELSKASFSNTIAQPVLGEPEPVAWAIRKNDPALLLELNTWLASPSGQSLRDRLYQKYFADREGYQERTEDDLFAAGAGNISQFDTLLEREAKGIGWDWRLLAAQESRFDPRARSFAGARGLLQLMPRTAREMGVRNSNNPQQNVAGGVKYLARLTDAWKDEIPDDTERLKFVLASYNAGRGHVLDAQRLAAKNGDDPQNWDDVAYWLMQKSKRSVYRDPVVQHGYVRGLEPVQYVNRILKRYDRYRSGTDDSTSTGATQ